MRSFQLTAFFFAMNFAMPANGFEFDTQGIVKEMGQFTLADLLVGDKGRFARWGSVCVMDGSMHAVSSARISDEDYGLLWQFAVLPGQTVAATIVEDDGAEPEPDDLRDFVEALIREVPNCDGMEIYFANRGGPYYEIKTVNGVSNLSELMEQTND